MTSEKKILIGPSTFAEKDKEPLTLLQNAGYRVVDNPYKRKFSKAELIALLDEQVVGLIAGLETLDREVLANSKLRCVSRVGSGISNIDLDAARDLNIAVRNTPDGPTQAVAELTIASLLALLRSTHKMNGDLHAGKWTKVVGRQLEGLTCLVIGFGRIGRRVARLLKAFGANVVVHDPFAKRDDEFKVFTLLEEALPSADVILLHHSGEACVLGSPEFERIKHGVWILNAARGGAIHEESLVNALTSGKVQGAWMDTFAEEPYKGTLVRFENVLLTPHVGSYTLECRRAMEMDAVKNLLAVIG
jgi:D-3-phosphoglycerate dehydrogenase